MNRANILIVDDEKLDRYLLNRDLKRAQVDADIVEFSSGVDALEFLEQVEVEAGAVSSPVPKIIFLDINMPRLSGLEFLDKFEELRAKHKAFDGCAIMMMSSSEHPEERERALSHGFVVDFVTKGSIDSAALSAKVAAVLEA